MLTGPGIFEEREQLFFSAFLVLNLVHKLRNSKSIQDVEENWNEAMALVLMVPDLKALEDE